MHVHFVFPRWQKLLEDRPELKETLSGYDIGSFRMAGLGAATAVGALPPGHTVTFVDQNIEEVDFDVEANVVGISFFTPQATNAYRIADAFRARGKRVIGGGIHPTMAPEDTLAHFDAIVRGPVEGLWEGIIADAERGALRRSYAGEPSAAFAMPRRDIFSRSKYLMAGVVQSARGCSLRCPFCVVPGCYGTREVRRPLDDVIEDIETLPFPAFFFADENLLFSDEANALYMRELMARLAERKNRKAFFTASYPDFVRVLPEADIELLARARMRQIYLVLGLKRPLKDELRDDMLRKAVTTMKRHGVEALASFMLGNDLDDEDVEPRIGEFSEATHINLAEFTLLTPFPGTQDFARMQAQGRLRTLEWSKYNGANVVFEPLHESAGSLEQRYLDLWRRHYAPISRTDVYTRYVRGFGGGILRTPAADGV